MSNTLRWLHLSDFHMGQDAYGQGKIAQYIVKHVKQHPQPVDFIFITGDIGFSGQADDYTRFQQQFVKPMTALLGPETVWLMVPGNHDVDRKRVKHLDRSSILHEKNTVFEPTEQGLSERQCLLPGLQHYRQHIQAPAQDWLASEQGVFHSTYQRHGMQLGIVGINTAWLCKDDQDKGQLTPGKALVEEGLQQIQDCTVKIVLGHHPIEDWLQADQKPIKALFRQHNVLYLHGHLHETWVEQEPKFLTLQAGAAFQGREHALWKNRLLWGELTQQQVRLTPYCWAEQHQTWTPDSDAFHPEHKVKGQDQWAFDLPTMATNKKPVTPSTPEPGVKTYLAKLPVVSQECFGRKTEFKQLDQALNDAQTNLFTLVAWGGMGKTTLVGHWLIQLQKEGYRQLQRVFGWSFYSQGSGEDRQASSDLFIQAALQWFGEDFESGSLWDKGVRLATCICRQPTLLILDGLEPLQYPPGEMQGRLKDQGLQALLRELAYAPAGWGLCVVTTRVSVADVAAQTGGSVQERQLEALSREAGVALLTGAGIVGSAAELDAAVQAYAGHALALTLLGSYLRVVHAGDIRKRDLIAALTDQAKQGGHAKRVLASYEEWLGASERNVLYALGLFDRPASAGAIEALRQTPTPTGWLSKLVRWFKASPQLQLPKADWLQTIQHLRDVKLLAAADPSQPEQLDCHPLVREYFSDKLRLTQPELWQAAHFRLYEYYQALPEKHQPDTLAELEPLYRAVAHGCLAGCVQEVLDKVYHERIERKEGYSVKKLSAFGPDLAAVAVFFDAAWSTPSAALTQADQAWVLNLAGFCLRALGRLREALGPLSAALQREVEQKNWKNAAGDASNLSQLQLTLGQVASAVETGRRGVEYADQSEDWFQRMDNCTTLADALLKSGDSTAAQSLFQEAEAIQKAERPEEPTLYSVQGYRFCDLLLQTHDKSVALRATTALEIAERNQWPLELSLDHLTLGRYALQQTFRQNTGDFSQAQLQLDQAVAGLRQAGYQDYLTRSLLARAACMRAQANYPAAWKDLREAQDIAERGEMKLFIADCHLEAARLRQAQGLDVAEQVAQAKVLIEQTGYHRRDGELLELQ